MQLTKTTNRRWLGFELSVLRRLKFQTIAIPFSGHPDLDWYLKFWGKQILSNDICQWAWTISRALVENQGEMLTEEDVSLALSEAYVPRRRLSNQALAGLADHPGINDIDVVWFDNLWLNIQQIENEYRRALAAMHVIRTIDYVFSFDDRTIELRRPLSEVFISLWRSQWNIINNDQANYSINREAQEFIRGARGDLMFARFPRPEGLSALRQTVVGWRETWIRGSEGGWDELIAGQRGRLGDDVLSKEHYLQLVSNFLLRAKHLPKWAISHTDDGFISAGEMAEVIRQFRKIEITYNKDFSDVVGGRNTFIFIA